jgi:hypothetical protein
MQPSVTISELDGQLGVVPSTAGRLLAVIGCSTAGPMNVPTPASSVSDIGATFGQGRLPEAAAMSIAQGRAVVAVRAAAADFGSYSTLYNVIKDGDSTSTIGVTAPDPTHYPADDMAVVFTITKGGTVGTAGIEYKFSLDGGRSYSAVSSLGTALFVVLPGSGSIKVTLATGIVTDGDSISFTVTGPNFDSIALTAALTALSLSSVDFEIIAIAGPLDPTLAAVVEAQVTAMRTKEMRHSWIGHVRQQMINDGSLPGTLVPEKAADYIQSISTAFADFITKQGGLTASDGYVTSALSGTEQRRQLSWLYAPLTAAASEEEDVADVNRGALPFRITDINGNPEPGCYNETRSPGLSDAGFVTARTWNGGKPAGVYVNLPLLKSAVGSDFDIHPMRRVMDLGQDTAYGFFVRRLNQPVQVDKSTGKLKEATRKAMQAAAQAELESVLLAKPKASDVTVIVSDADNVLSTKTIHVTIWIEPLAYPTAISITMGFRNPALSVQAV